MTISSKPAIVGLLFVAITYVFIGWLTYQMLREQECRCSYQVENSCHWDVNADKASVVTYEIEERKK